MRVFEQKKKKKKEKEIRLLFIFHQLLKGILNILHKLVKDILIFSSIGWIKPTNTLMEIDDRWTIEESERLSFCESLGGRQTFYLYYLIDFSHQTYPELYYDLPHIISTMLVQWNTAQSLLYSCYHLPHHSCVAVEPITIHFTLLSFLLFNNNITMCYD